MDGRSITYNQSPVKTVMGCYFLYCRPLLYLCLSAQSERPIKRSNRKYRVLNKLRKRNGGSLFIARHFARFLHLCTMVLKPHIHQRIVCLSLSPTVSITVISISRGACRKINKFVKLKPNKSSHQPTTRALVLAGWLAHWQVLFS